MGTREALLDAVLSLTYSLPQLGGLQITEERAMDLEWDDFLRYHKFQERTREQVAAAIRKGMRTGRR